MVLLVTTDLKELFRINHTFLRSLLLDALASGKVTIWQL
jgi:hypothetical protein